ncbi:hypothetical protein DYB28_002832 [Aphanomyces astaci]|uniref:Protein kinase domain-containing protein n=1 Tax=Aphanomyces astaci TaxID=112090 RepID=A0A9X8DXQ7_APHAT|nr:hypothetical protein DYB28_002832 [Aphanomyces astaci]
MDSPTFDALNTSLQPNNTADDATLTDGSKAFTGYNYYNLSITTSMTDCSINKGTLTELWPDKRFRNFKYKDAMFTVCVVPSTTMTPTAVPIRPTPSKTSQGLGTGAIAGIAGGAVIAVVAVLLCWYRRRPNPVVKSPEYYHALSTPATVTTVSATPIPTTTTNLPQVNLSALQLVRVANGEVYIDHMIGTGAFANVFHGSFQGRAVAVKMLLKSRTSTVSQIQSFVHEIQLMSQFDSPYIVNLVGAAWTRADDLKCVMEFMDGGDLKEYLDTHSSQEFAWADKYVHLLSIADGLCYLHSMNVIHRDIKSRNVLLDSTKGTKLTDFGISKEDIQATMTVGVGTFRWMAPEVLQDQGYDVSADIYSFGMLLSEFDTHRVPYEDMKNSITRQPIADSAIVLKVVSGSIRPTFTSECPPWILELAAQCLAWDPTDRPTAMQLSYMIRSKLKEMSSRLFSI